MSILYQNKKRECKLFFKYDCDTIFLKEILAMIKYIVIGLIVVVALYVLATYNALVKRKNMVLNQRSQIDIELQRRFDLIPNLVEVVKGYASHEKSTLEDVVNARSNYLASGSDTQEALQADAQLTTALSRLFMLVESYPDLMANTNFLNLQKELANTEKKIAFSRQFYNDSVNKMNNMIQMFPSNVVAKLFGYKAEPFFETTDKERANISIDL